MYMYMYFLCIFQNFILCLFVHVYVCLCLSGLWLGSTFFLPLVCYTCISICMVYTPHLYDDWAKGFQGRLGQHGSSALLETAAEEEKSFRLDARILVLQRLEQPAPGYYPASSGGEIVGLDTEKVNGEIKSSEFRDANY